MKLHFLLLLLLLFSSHLSAVTSTAILQQAKLGNTTIVKEKPNKNFFQNISQHILENKIAQRLERKKSKEKGRGKAKTLGLLALIFSALGLLGLFASSNAVLIVAGLFLGLAGFVLGVIGVCKVEKTATSIIAIVFGTFAVLVLLGGINVF